MKYVVLTWSLAVLIIIIRGWFAIIKDSQKNVVHLPNWFLPLGTAVSLVFLVPAIFADMAVWETIALIVLSSLGPVFIIGYVNSRIYYDNNGFYTINFFGIRRSYTYDQITLLIITMFMNYICIGKRRISMHMFAKDWVDFIYVANKRYKKLTKQKKIPIVDRDDKSIFKGNVDDAEGFTVIFAMLVIAAIGILVLAADMVYFTPKDSDDVLSADLSFISCELQDDTLVMTSLDNKIYKIRYVDDEVDIEQIKSFCDQKSILTVRYEEKTPKGEPYNSILAISQGEKDILTFEDSRRLNRGAYWPIMIFAGIGSGLLLFYVVGAIIVGRNPKKYGKRVVKFFFKEEYVNWDD